MEPVQRADTLQSPQARPRRTGLDAFFLARSRYRGSIDLPSSRGESRGDSRRVGRVDSLATAILHLPDRLPMRLRLVVHPALRQVTLTHATCRRAPPGAYDPPRSRSALEARDGQTCTIAQRSRRSWGATSRTAWVKGALLVSSSKRISHSRPRSCRSPISRGVNSCRTGPIRPSPAAATSANRFGIGPSVTL
jgi:hypothetical protein